MPKKKRKTKASRATGSRSFWEKRLLLLQYARILRKRPLLAGLMFMLVAAVIGWIMVSAQSSSGLLTPFGGNKNTNETQGSSGQGSDNNGAGSKDANKDAKSNPTDPKKTDKPTTTPPTTATAPAPPSPSPTPPPPPIQPPAGWHENITVTIFWVGEEAGPDNAGISNAQSAWDGYWEQHYGGYDDPDNRNGYFPAGFTPLENPFYFALPYNDLDENGDRKASASNCPNIGGSISWCKNAWIKIVKGSKAAYAQWQDVGPMNEDDAAYVFGNAAPANQWGAKAGLDVSPAVRDYLGLAGIDTVSWTFVPAADVPAGPWKQIVTTSPGGW